MVVIKDINTVSARCPSAAEIRAIDRDLKLEFDSDPTRGVIVRSSVRRAPVRAI